MIFIEHQLSQRQSMCQTLHHRIEEASITVILHRKSAVVFVFSDHKSVGLLSIHHFKTAAVTAFGYARQTGCPG
jgi:hypothetical protein